MSLEVGTYIADLVSTNPPGTDKRHQGDDHLRLIKAAAQATFPNANAARYFWSSEVAVASGATCDILGAASEKVQITGNNTITSFGAGINKVRYVRFAAALILTHNATSLILPGAANINTAAGDTCIVVSDASSNCRVYAYSRGAGVPPSVSPFMATVLDDTTATIARATLGLTIGTNVQAWDAMLDELATYNTNGFLVQTAANTLVGRSLTAGNGVAISNNTGVAGNPTISIDNTTDWAFSGTLALQRNDNNVIMTVTSTEPSSSAGPRISLRRLGGSPLANDFLAQFIWSGEDSDVASQEYGNITMQIVDPTVGNETGRFVWSTSYAGALAVRTYLGGGLYTATMTDQGPGTINALTLYQNNVTLASLFQPLDSDLTGLAALATTGYLTRTGSGTFAARTFTATSPLAITNGDGIAGASALSLLVNVDFAWTVAQSITSAVSSVLVLTSTIATGSQAPQLDLVRDITGVTGENIGQIRWRSKDSVPNAIETMATMGINIVNATSGAEATRLFFSTRTGGAGAAVRFYAGVGMYTVGVADMGVDTINALTLYENGVGLSAKYAAMASANAFTASQSISQAVAGTILTLTSTGAGAAIGPVILFDRNKGAGVDGDLLGGLVFQGRDDASAVQQYGAIKCVLIDNLNTGERGSIVIQSTVLGAAVDTLSVGDGVIVGAPTGSYLGAGKLNAVGLYDDSVLVSDFVFERLATGAEKLELGDLADADPLYIQKNYSAFWKANNHLPSMPRRDDYVADKRPIGGLLSGLWQAIELTSIHVDELEDRILALEAA